MVKKVVVEAEGENPFDHSRRVALRKQLQRLKTPYILLYGPITWIFTFGLYFVGVFTVRGAILMSMAYTLTQVAPAIALMSEKHYDWLLTVTLIVMTWCGDASLSSPPSEEVWFAYNLIQGTAMMFQIMLACGLQLPTRCFYTYISCSLVAWVAARFYFVSTVYKVVSEHDYMSTMACATAGGLMSVGIRTLTDEALESFVKSDVQRRNAEEQRHSFLAYIMHEVRNPLNVTALLVCEQLASIGETAVQLAKEGGGKAAVVLGPCLDNLKELSVTIQAQVEQMGAICNDVLHLEQLTAGRFKYAFICADVQEFFNNLAKQTERVMQSKPLHFDTEIYIDPKLAGRVIVTWADFNRLRQVLGNFFSNARKYTPANGKVIFTLCASILPDAPTHCKGTVPHYDAFPEAAKAWGGTAPHWISLRFGVRDTGMGVAFEDLPKLFKAYSAIRAGTAMNAGGTGLGLCISRAFVEAHCDGRIGASSDGEGKGSEFFFEFSAPLRPTAADLIAAAKEQEPNRKLRNNTVSPSPLRRRRSSAHSAAGSRRSSHSSVFIVSRRNSLLELNAQNTAGSDDSKNSEDTPKGYNITAPVTPKTLDPEPPAVSSSSSSSVTASASASAAAAARSLPRVRRQVVEEDEDNASFDEEDLKKMQQEGTEAVMEEEKKQETQAEVKEDETVEEASDKTPCSSKKAASSSSDGFTADILLVEDSSMCQMAVSLTLRRMGFTTSTADDGVEAVDKFKVAGERYRMVLMDRNMPRMEGPEAIEKIKAHLLAAEAEQGEKQMMPLFVGLTGQTQDVEDFHVAGAKSVLFKPVTTGSIQSSFDDLGFYPKVQGKKGGFRGGRSG
uniref:histidine kinase n=1 Tax=Chromera velia CCMP2878 TaxID=1169474 RepID=A0A0G4IEE1_9ALVE|eukprot:Cvel_13560.t1-p1 / transcript=Cvel_13560.t1 / gene=Cvel_13560 / organism=Chromera_velia_CCMP2878 / gene_product=Sensory/regulatory protein RpfC, putative / transcript_product=Sensory/regulatory protein RpfC, putative / location=Cvel_scaffold931:53531-56704(-) / protein_length=841 / sequence_SO=supercontig / SO=protein_coding / is_pseudo=false